MRIGKREWIPVDEDINFDRKKLQLFVLIVGLIIISLLGREVFGAENADLYGGAALLGNRAAGAASLSDGEAAVYFLDAGQGDCSLIMAGGSCVLIDGGYSCEGGGLVGELYSFGVTRLDLVIATHPHDDHFGGLVRVLEEIPAERLLIPEVYGSTLPRTRNFGKLLAAAELGNVSVEYARAGIRFELGGAVLEIVSPTKISPSLNDNSIAARFIHGENAFLFTGDMENAAEKALIKENTELYADVLKVAHHGSAGSNCAEFLEAVSPKYAVIEAGSGNIYELPDTEVIERLSAVGCRELYATSLNGNITFISDGEDIRVESEKGQALELDKLL